MPLDKTTLLEGNASDAKNGLSAAAPAPRRTWGKAGSKSSTGSAATNTSDDSTSKQSSSTNNNGSSKQPRWGGSLLKRSATTEQASTSNNNNTMPPLRRTATQQEREEKPAMDWGTLKKVATKTEKETTKIVEMVISNDQWDHDDDDTTTMTTIERQQKQQDQQGQPVHSPQNSTVTASTADMTLEQQRDEEPPTPTTFVTSKDDSDDNNNNKDMSNSKKRRGSSKNKSKTTKNKGSPFALDEKEYKKQVPPEKRTKGTFDWSGVDSVLRGMNVDKKTEKKRDKLQEKLANINATREDALKMMRDHVEDQKKRLDESKDKLRQKIREQCGGMTYTEMLEKVKENHEIVASLKKSNNKLRTDTDKMHAQVRNLRVNNMKLEAANQQSQAVLEQLKERKKSVDARYDHLTKVIIPPYQERIKEMQEVVAERKSYGINEHRTRVRYGNYILRFLDKVDTSDESKKFKAMIWELGSDVQGGDLKDLCDDDDDDDDSENTNELDVIEMPPPPAHLNESINLGDMKDQKITTNHEDDDDSDNDKPAATANANKKNNGSKRAAGDEKSLWDRYGSSKSGNASSDKLNLNNASSSSLSSGKHNDLLQKANRAKAGANFNGAVILSDSESDSDSESKDDDSSVDSDSS
jgi:hypothetical protein